MVHKDVDVMEPESPMVTTHKHPVDKSADHVAAERGTGGPEDLINVPLYLETVATILAVTDYTNPSGKIPLETVA